MLAKLKDIKAELRKRMHQPIPEQGAWLKRVVSGYFNYPSLHLAKALVWVSTESRGLSKFPGQGG
jgi:hypothetical protein